MATRDQMNTTCKRLKIVSHVENLPPKSPVHIDFHTFEAVTMVLCKEADLS